MSVVTKTEVKATYSAGQNVQTTRVDTISFNMGRLTCLPEGEATSALGAS